MATRPGGGATKKNAFFAASLTINDTITSVIALKHDFRQSLSELGGESTGNKENFHYNKTYCEITHNNGEKEILKKLNCLTD